MQRNTAESRSITPQRGISEQPHREHTAGLCAGVMAAVGKVTAKGKRAACAPRVPLLCPAAGKDRSSRRENAQRRCVR